MRRLTAWYLAIVLLSLALLVACGEATPSPGSPREAAQQVARAYVLASPTYAFDGIPETLVLVSQTVITGDVTFKFLYEFDSRHAGYGDRTGQALAQVITRHRASITVENGKVTSAIMDDAWDMQAQATVGGKI